MRLDYFERLMSVRFLCDRPGVDNLHTDTLQLKSIQLWSRLCSGILSTVYPAALNRFSTTVQRAQNPRSCTNSDIQAVAMRLLAQTVSGDSTIGMVDMEN